LLQQNIGGASSRIRAKMAGLSTIPAFAGGNTLVEEKTVVAQSESTADDPAPAMPFRLREEFPFFAPGQVTRHDNLGSRDSQAAQTFSEDGFRQIR